MRSEIKQNAAEVLARLYGDGIGIAERHKQALRIGGMDIGTEARSATDTKKTVRTDGRGHLWLFPEQADKARNRKEDPQEGAESYYGRIPAEWKKQWAGKEITSAEWKPARVDRHTPELRKFIKSSIPRFDRISAYEPFYLYVEQGKRWRDEGTTVEDYQGEEQVLYALREMERILTNRLYGMDKYGWIKDDEVPGGRKYYASTPQALIAYLLDCGYSLEIGKGRQAAITSTVMLYEIMTMLVRSSYSGVLVTDDVEFTGKRIFGDKLKGCYQFLRDKQPWIRPTKVPNYADKNIVFDWSGATSKDEAKLRSSSYSLAASDDTQTINGNTPSKVVFDEAQNIPTYTDIKLEARPTMLSSGADGTIRIRRQIVGYGTGSSNQRGKGSFENEYKGTIKKWFEGKETSSFVPLFLDWTCRPNMTDARYGEEYDFYLSNNEGEMAGMSKEARTAQFHAAYPSRVEDMFLTSHKTIIPQILIKQHQDRILEKCHAQGLTPMFGRFEMIPDLTRPMPEGSYIPHYIKGAKWVRSEDDDFEAPIRMLIPPEGRWTKRWVKGTDPIQSPTGNSKFSSLILDKAGYIGELEGQRYYKPVVACTLNWKNEVVEENFLQSALMGMYYANVGQRACMEVFEINQGQDYGRWMMGPGIDLGKSLWTRLAMPMRYRGGGHAYGLGLKSGGKGGSKAALYADVRNGLLDMGDGIWHYEIFTQANNVVVEEKDMGGMAYYPRNKNVDNDDLLDAFGFALISAEIEAGDPRELGKDAPLKVKKMIYDRDPRNPLVLIEREIEVPIRY